MVEWIFGWDQTFPVLLLMEYTILSKYTLLSYALEVYSSDILDDDINENLCAYLGHRTMICALDKHVWASLSSSTDVHVQGANMYKIQSSQYFLTRDRLISRTKHI